MSILLTWQVNYSTVITLLWVLFRVPIAYILQTGSKQPLN